MPVRHTVGKAGRGGGQRARGRARRREGSKTTIAATLVLCPDAVRILNLDETGDTRSRLLLSLLVTGRLFRRAWRPVVEGRGGRQGGRGQSCKFRSATHTSSARPATADHHKAVDARSRGKSARQREEAGTGHGITAQKRTYRGGLAASAGGDPRRDRRWCSDEPCPFAGSCHPRAPRGKFPRWRHLRYRTTPGCPFPSHDDHRRPADGVRAGALGQSDAMLATPAGCGLRPGTRHAANSEQPSDSPGAARQPGFRGAHARAPAGNPQWRPSAGAAAWSRRSLRG